MMTNLSCKLHKVSSEAWFSPTTWEVYIKASELTKWNYDITTKEECFILIVLRIFVGFQLLYLFNPFWQHHSMVLLVCWWCFLDSGYTRHRTEKTNTVEVEINGRSKNIAQLQCGLDAGIFLKKSTVKQQTRVIMIDRKKAGGVH